ncbi:glycosyltransferase [Candidatus Pacearchaeota archaeon]|nr:glycosyltransferase [Candidatus Pacearchaeota archaeon]
MYEPKATIMIPAYNVQDFIGESLKSAINQTFKGNYEILVVNDGSVDDTQGKIEWYKNKSEKIKLINQDNQGTSVARNKLLDEARGEILFGLDADDVLSLDALDKIIFLYNKFPFVNHIYTDQKEIDEQGREIVVRRRGKIHQFSKDLNYNCHFQGHLKSFRKNIIGDTCFNEIIKSAVDWDFFLNLYLKLNILHFPEVLYSYRMNEQGISFTKREQVRANSKSLVEKYLKKHNVYEDRDFEVVPVKLKDCLTYYDHFVGGESTMNPKARIVLEEYLLNGS